MRKLFKERKLFKGGNYMRKYGTQYKKPTFAQNIMGSCVCAWDRPGLGAQLAQHKTLIVMPLHT